MVRAICALHEGWDADRYPMRSDVVAMYERWLPERARDPRSVFLVSESEGCLTGFLVGTVEASVPIYRVTEYGFIHDVWVEPAARGRGVGRALVRSALAAFRAIGVAQVRLETATANEPARRAFAAEGFRTATQDMILVLEPSAGE